jgi:hypothetical protein
MDGCGRKKEARAKGWLLEQTAISQCWSGWRPHFRYARAPILMARPRLPRKPLPAARSELRTLAFDDLTTLYLGDHTT